MRKCLLSFSMLLLVVAVALAACVPATPGSDIEPGADIVEFVQNPRVRVRNDTALNFDQLTLRMVDGEVTFAEVAAGTTTPYQDTKAAYQLVVLAATVDGDRSDYGELYVEEASAEPPIPIGEYTYVIEQTGDGTLYAQMEPDDEIARQLLAPVLEMLAGTGRDVAYERSVQRGTPFDTLAGETIARRELVNVDGKRLEVYIFADEGTAVEMGTAVQPGGNTLQRAGGERLFLDAGPGSRSTWWQNGRFLVRYEGSDQRLIDDLVTALDDPLHAVRAAGLEIRIANIGHSPLDAVVADFVGQAIDYGPIPARSVTAYQPVNEAYRYAGLRVEVAGETLELIPIDYVGETPLEAGRYTYALQAKEGALEQAMLSDDKPFLDERLLERDWYWLETTGDGELVQPAADAESEMGRWPHLTFTGGHSPNSGEEGWLFHGFSGCNGIGGTYFVTPDGALVIPGIGGTEVLCAEEVMAGELFLQEFLTGITHYYLADDGMLWIFDGQGRQMGFGAEPNN